MAGGVVAESEECSDDGWESREAHWRFIGNFDGRTSECSKSEDRRVLEYF